MNQQGNNDNRHRICPHPIEGMYRLTPCQLKAFEDQWMTTIESFVAAASTEEGRAGLCRALDVGFGALDSLLQDARDSLGEERYLELSTARPGGQTGALRDDKSVRRVDNEPDDRGNES